VPPSSETKQTLRFIFIVCFISAFLLSSLAMFLKEPQQKAKELDRSKQLLLAAGINEKDVFATYAARIRPGLVDKEGQFMSFEQAGIDYPSYLQKYQKTGFANLPLKLIYEIHTEDKIDGYVIPVNGFGLWDAIYGYLAIKADGNTVLGATWYSQAETAGLGANISLPEWQEQFRNKVIFQPSASGSTNFTRAPLGLTVIKGRVGEVLGDSPKARSSVDGISGASLTGKGVTDAYFDCLAPYRPFFLKLRDKHG
jgi:Na+-transporting NADH:ubiquinone oxidoreductase subunit C